MQVGRLENAIGWYHSHPGYGCWLSGIDVSTQMLNQQFQEPFVAIVVCTMVLSKSSRSPFWYLLQIDPIRTVSAGKVNLGAFRTYPKGYKPSSQGPSEYQTIPLEKIEDFGIHCKQWVTWLSALWYTIWYYCKHIDITHWMWNTLNLPSMPNYWTSSGTNIGWIHCHLVLSQWYFNVIQFSNDI